METSLTSFLDSLSTFVFRFAAICFVLVNGAAIAGFAITRNRRLVNEWTSRVVTADVVLLAGGLGVPLVAALAKMGVHALASLFGGGAAPVR